MDPRRQGAPSLFEARDGRLYFAPGRLGVPAADPERLRRGLDPERLREHGLRDPPSDEILACAARAGFTSSPAFLNAIDDRLVRAPCFCHYYTWKPRQAQELEGEIREMLDYYSQDSYESSNAFYRNLAFLSRDLTDSELRGVLRHERGGQREPDPPRELPKEIERALAALNRLPGIGAFVYPHTPGFWLCSTPEARKLTRGITRLAKKEGRAVSIVVASSLSVFGHARHKYRHYAVQPQPGASTDPLPAGEFWAVVRRVVEQKREAARPPPRARQATGPAPPRPAPPRPAPTSRGAGTTPARETGKPP